MLLHDRFELGETLGQGGFGATRVALDKQTGAEVVVKELRIKGLPDWKPVEHFEREVKVLRALKHPGVPKLVDAFEEENDGTLRLYIVTERVPGHTLAQRIEHGDRWNEEGARKLLTSLLDTLRYLHGLSPQVVHRDIKPGNIVITPDERPVLVDFGAVRDLAARQGGDMTVLGTPGYMAPEQALGNADARSDLYGLGTTMLHALTHQHPTQLPRKDLHFRFEEIVGLPKAVVEVLSRMTDPDPGQRFSTAAEVLAALAGEQDSRRPSTAIATRPVDGAVAIPDAPRPMTRAVARKFRMTSGMRHRGPAAPLFIAAGVAAAVAAGTLGYIGATVLVPVIMIGLFGGIFGLAFRHIRRGKELYRTGARAMGRVISARHVQHGGAHVEYEYDVGERFEGRLHTSDVTVVNALRPGMEVAVFYDPSNPKDHVAFLEPEFPVLAAGD